MQESDPGFFQVMSDEELFSHIAKYDSTVIVLLAHPGRGTGVVSGRVVFTEAEWNAAAAAVRGVQDASVVAVDKYGSDLHRTEPAELPLAHVGDISAGVQHTCAVTGDGSGYCWGQNNRGQLGVNFGYGVEPGPYGEDTPVRVDSDMAFDRIFVGSEHTCALSGSTPYCWGGNELGQLGTGAARPYPGTNVEVLITPTAVVAPFDE